MTAPPAFVFVYGSLLQPASLQATLPTVSWRRCVPAVVSGRRRDFGVAFPNDGTQPDKAYLDDQDVRPPVVLFANLRPAGPAESVNGICVPVGPGELAQLEARELRYDTVDVTDAVRASDAVAATDAVGATAAADVTHAARPSPSLTRVVTFVGKPEFTRAPDVAAGVVPVAYTDSIDAGARFWDRHVSGFHADLRRSTDWPDPSAVVPLRRVG
ncbi:gamma-glutamylcyclotransferase family protein [Georgenia sp. MJ173]|uniref:gamma-glutamylcyclotransferase family protein n=1 Tax=Georgenia sunbinii TaxID=3117728 RepID=UPI002F2619E9